MGCGSTGGGSSSLYDQIQGTWKVTYSSTSWAQYVFSGYNFAYTSTAMDGGYNVSGTYTMSGSSLTFTKTSGPGDAPVCKNASVNGTTLTLTNSDGTGSGVDYTKQ